MKLRTQNLKRVKEEAKIQAYKESQRLIASPPIDLTNFDCGFFEDAIP